MQVENHISDGCEYGLSIPARQPTCATDIPTYTDDKKHVSKQRHHHASHRVVPGPPAQASPGPPRLQGSQRRWPITQTSSTSAATLGWGVWRLLVTIPANQPEAQSMSDDARGHDGNSLTGISVELGSHSAMYC